MSNLNWEEQQREISEAIKRFPDEFGFRNFPNAKFKISQIQSYFSKEIMLFTLIWNNKANEWQAFAKGTEKDLRSQIVKL